MNWLAFILLVSASAMADEKFDPAWVACKVAKDCVPVSGACGETTCVAAKSIKPAQEYYKKAAADVKCIKPPRAKEVKIECRAKRCHCEAAAE